MERYRNLGGDSGVYEYEIDPDYDLLKMLPSKGSDSAEFFLKFLTNDTIPTEIQEAFENLLK